MPRRSRSGPGRRGRWAAVALAVGLIVLGAAVVLKLGLIVAAIGALAVAVGAATLAIGRGWVVRALAVAAIAGLAAVLVAAAQSPPLWERPGWSLDDGETPLGEAGAGVITATAFEGAEGETGDAALRARAIGDGELVWEVELERAPNPFDPMAGTFVVGDVVIVAAADGPERAYDAGDGSLLWERDLPGPPLARAGRIAVFDGEDRDLAVALRTGTTRWRSDIGDVGAVATLVTALDGARGGRSVPNGRFVLSSRPRDREASTAAIDLRTGAVVWRGAGRRDYAISGRDLVVAAKRTDDPGSAAGGARLELELITLPAAKPRRRSSYRLEPLPVLPAIFGRFAWGVHDGRLVIGASDGVRSVALDSDGAETVPLPDGWSFAEPGLETPELDSSRLLLVVDGAGDRALFDVLDGSLEEISGDPLEVVTGFEDGAVVVETRAEGVFDDDLNRYQAFGPGGALSDPIAAGDDAWDSPILGPEALMLEPLGGDGWVVPLR